MAPVRLWMWFGITGVIMTVALAISPVRHVFPEWKGIQKRYNRLAQERYEMGQDVRPVPLGLRQIWNPRLGVVDRCTTCHLGVDEPTLRDAEQPFRAHPATPHELVAIGCTICHRGQGRASTTEAAHGATRHWESMLPSYYVSGSCGSCHREINPPEARTVSQGRRLIERAACAACHAIPGFRIERQPAVDLSGIGSKVRPEWLYRWLKQPFDYLPKSRMPDFHLSDAEAKTLTSYLLSFRSSVLETLAGPNLESSLVNPGVEEVAHGEARYREARCVSCHSQDGRGGVLGPEVGRIGSKVKPTWLDAWIREPRKLVTDSTMPQYGFTVRDRHAVVSYMLSEFVDFEADPAETRSILASLPEADGSVMAEGERLYRLYGCGQCHRLRGVERRGEFGADLSAEGIKDIDQLDFGSVDIKRSLVDWLYAKVRTPRIFSKRLKMPDYHFTEEEARQVTAALLSLTGDSVPPEYLPPQVAAPVYEPGGAFGRILEKYQCLSCHPVRGVGGDMAPDLTREGSMAKPDWLARYFDLPYTLRPIMTERMPNLGMSKEEIRTTVAYLKMVLVDDSVPEEIFDSPPDRAMVESGRRLFYEKYACQACHQTNQKGGYVGPPLDGVKDRLLSGYIHEWLLDPQRLLAHTIDPKQGMTPNEAAAITAFLYSLPAAGGTK